MELTKGFKLVGVDAGNLAVKYTWFCGGQIRYGHISNIIGRAIALDNRPASPMGEEIISAGELYIDNNVYRKEYFVGELARRQLQEYAGSDWSDDFVKNGKDKKEQLRLSDILTYELGGK